MDGVEQYHREMELAWDYVDAKYRADEIFGEEGSQIILRLGTRASHHDMPYAMSVLAGLVGCTNGASVAVFPGGDASPISIAFLNVNMPQTRKSQITNAVTKLGKAIDLRTLHRVRRALQAESMETQEAPRRTAPPEPRIHSTTLTSFTEAAFFQRCAGDWCQVSHPESAGELRGRFHYSTVLNVDEAYKFLKMLGLVSTFASDKRVDASAVPDAASEFNKLMQTGHAALATKTSGTFGDSGAPHVNIAAVGNVHPSMWIPIERCEAGTNHVAVKERLLVATGRPIEPHHGIPLHLQTEAGFKRWSWSPLLRVMVGPLGLPVGADDPSRAMELFDRVEAPIADGSDDEGDIDADFVPDAKGYRATLIDGYTTRVRFRKSDVEGTRLMPEFRVANRDISLPEGQDLTSMANRVLSYFSESHMDIPWTAAAKLLFKGFCAVFTANTAVARGDNQIATAARLGAAPWHLSNLSAALLVFDIAIGQQNMNTGEYRDKRLQVQESHVTRAYKLLSFLHGISACWSAPGTPRSASARLASQDLAAAARRLCAPDRTGQLPRSQFGEFALTQEVLASSGAGLLEPLRAPAEAAPAAPSPQPLAFAEEQAGRSSVQFSPHGPARAAGNSEPRHLLQIGDRNLPPMDEGYGSDGASVQDPVHGAVICSDREVMQKTLLRGEPVIFGRKVIDSIHVKRRRSEGSGYTKENVRLAHWKAVMQEGLAQYRVGRYDSGADCAQQPNQPRIYLELPPDDQDELREEYHNRLMMLCQLPYIKLTESILKRHQKGAVQRIDIVQPPVAGQREAPRRRAAGGAQQQAASVVEAVEQHTAAAGSAAAGAAAAAAPFQQAAEVAAMRPPAARLGADA